MELNTENLIKFFTKKLEEAKEIDAVNNPDKLKRWWNSIMSCCARMGNSYIQRADSISFYPGYYFMGESDYSVESRKAESRQSGLREAVVLIESIVDELNDWGFCVDRPKNNESISKNSNINNINISQSQSQNMKIDISDCNTESRQYIEDLIKELNGKKDKKVIKELLSKLTDVGLDVIEKIFLHSIGI